MTGIPNVRPTEWDRRLQRRERKAAETAAADTAATTDELPHALS